MKESFANRGAAYRFTGCYEKALKDCDRAIELESDNDRYSYLRSLTLTKLGRPTEAQTDLQSAIVLAQAKQAQNPMVSDRPEVIDWQNNFNLALYYLAAGRFEESDGLYSRSSEASRDSIEMAIRDLDDYLTLFPDRIQAQEVRDHLSRLV